MPLSKARDRERWNKRKLQPKLEALQPKLPFYAGAGDHFGEVKSQYYARRFLEA